MAFPQLRSGGLNLLAGHTASDYAIICEVGSYSWVGTDATLLTGYRLVAAAGTYVWTGTSATLAEGTVFSAEAGAWTWTGTDAALAYSADVAVGQQIWANPDIGRNYPRTFHPSLAKPFKFASAEDKTLDAESGSFVWAGEDTGPSGGYLIDAFIGEYSWTGREALLVYSNEPQILDRISFGVGLKRYRNYPRAFHPSHRKPFRVGIPRNLSLASEAGTWNWNGADAVLDYDPITPNVSVRQKKRNSWPRHFAPSPFGQLRSGKRLPNLLSMGRAFEIDGDSGTYTWTGTDASLLYGKTISAEGGAFTWTGAAANLFYGFTLGADAGTFTVTGTAATLLRGLKLDAGFGLFGWAGNDASLFAEERGLNAEAGSFAWTGTAADLFYGPYLDADEGQFFWSGVDARIIWSAHPPRASGRLPLLGVG